MDWLQSGPAANRIRICDNFENLNNNKQKLNAKSAMDHYKSNNITIYLSGEHNNRIKEKAYLNETQLLRKGSQVGIAGRLRKWNTDCLLSKDNPIEVDSEIPGYKYVPVVVGTNILRKGINDSVIIKLAALTQKKIYGIYARCITSLEKLNSKQVALLYNIENTKTQGVAMRLLLVVGAPVVLTQKVGLTFCKVSKGSIGTIKKIVFTDNVVYREESFNGVVVTIPSAPPQMVIIELVDKKLRDKQLVPGLPKGCVPIFPKKVQIQTDFLFKGVNKKMSFTTMQLPFEIAFGLTVDKIQGLTLDGIVICDLTIGRYNVPTQSLYVCVTRVAGYKYVRFLKKLTHNDLKYFVPNAMISREDERLKTMSDEYFEKKRNIKG